MAIPQKMLAPLLQKKSQEKAVVPQNQPEQEDDDFVGLGVNGTMAITQKLLAVNRGLEDPDDRDSWAYKTILTPDKLFAERIRMDAGKAKQAVMRRAIRTRSLQGLMPNAFGSYTEGMIKSHPLSMPLEEINPMHIVEQARRITAMGPGGLSSSDSITEEAQCHSSDTEVLTKAGWVFWPKVTFDTELACRVNGVLEYHKASKLHSAKYEGRMYGIKSRSVNLLVTPAHRLWTASSARTKIWGWETAAEHFGKCRVYLGTAAPYEGKDGSTTFTLPTVERTTRGYRLRSVPAMDMGDWCEFLGWFLSVGYYVPSGKEKHYIIMISQSATANPEKVQMIRELLQRLHFPARYYSEHNFVFHSKQLHTYLQQFGKAKVKFIPEFLFEVKPQYRRRFLQAFLLGDGSQSRGKVYSSSSIRLAAGIERLLCGMGVSSSWRAPWMAKNRKKEPCGLSYAVSELAVSIKEIKPENHFTEEYSGTVFCATVPGSLLFTRRGSGCGVWTGNSVSPSQFGFISALEGPESERAGIDVRLATNVRIGSDGKLYQMLRNARTGKLEWVSHVKASESIVQFPD